MHNISLYKKSYKWNLVTLGTSFGYMPEAHAKMHMAKYITLHIAINLS